MAGAYLGVNEENGLLLNKPKNTLTFRSTANLNSSVCFKQSARLIV